MRALLLAACLISFSVPVLAKIQYPAVLVSKIDDSTVTFHHCYNESVCRSIGDEQGYHIDSLNFSPKVKKAKAVAIGTGELAVGIFGGWLAGWAVWGAGATASLIWGTTAVSTAAITVMPSNYDALNPVLQWKMSNIEARIHKNHFYDNDLIVIEIDDEDQMNKFIRTLKKILAGIPD